MILIPRRRKVRIPIIASAGSRGAGFRGARARRRAITGNNFLANKEAPIHDDVKRKICENDDRQTDLISHDAQQALSSQRGHPDGVGWEEGALPGTSASWSPAIADEALQERRQRRRHLGPHMTKDHPRRNQHARSDTAHRPRSEGNHDGRSSEASLRAKASAQPCCAAILAAGSKHDRWRRSVTEMMRSATRASMGRRR